MPREHAEKCNTNLTAAAPARHAIAAYGQRDGAFQQCSREKRRNNVRIRPHRHRKEKLD